MFDSKLIEKAKQAKSMEELLDIAKENNVELTEEQAKTYFTQMAPQNGELADDELDNVSGGACVSVTAATCPICGSENVSISGTQDYPLIICHACSYSNSSSVV